MVPVEKRDQATLLPIIQEWILQGSQIHSDCWKSYNCLTKEGYEHLRVNHSIKFINLATGACTNRIESSWGAAKRSMNFPNRQKAHFSGYLAKYMFLKSSALRTSIRSLKCSNLLPTQSAGLCKRL